MPHFGQEPGRRARFRGGHAGSRSAICRRGAQAEPLTWRQRGKSVVNLPRCTRNRARRPGLLPEVRHGRSCRWPAPGTGEDNPELLDHTRRSLGKRSAGIRCLSSPWGSWASSGRFGLAPAPRGWVELALATPVVLWAAGLSFTILVVARLPHPNMYTLIGLGSALAYLYSGGRPRAGLFPPGCASTARRRHVLRQRPSS